MGIPLGGGVFNTHFVRFLRDHGGVGFVVFKDVIERCNIDGNIGDANGRNGNGNVFFFFIYGDFYGIKVETGLDFCVVTDVVIGLLGIVCIYSLCNTVVYRLE